MKPRTLFVLLSSVLLLSVLAIVEVRAQQGSSKATPAPSNWKAVDDAMGRAGQDQPDGAHKFSMPRSDLKVTLDGVELKPGFALGSWAAFQKMGNQSEVMGDLVLANDKGKALVESKCTVCHGLDEVRVANLEKPGWKELVESMRTKGADLKDEENTDNR